MIGQMRIRNRWRSMLQGLLGLNMAFQIVSVFTGWMVRVDDQNRYSHGPLYPFYVAMYLLVITLLIIEFVLYGKSFRKQNRMSLYAIMILVIGGILIQELMSGECRTAYIALTLGAVLMFIHYTEFSLLSMDENILKQQREIMTDALTGLYSRRAYSDMLKEYAGREQLPADLAIFVIDINDLKVANDTLGHDAGDELICGAARCIERAFGQTGRCFRTGGDEFVVFANLPREQAEKMLDALKRETGEWRGKKIGRLNLAMGCALAADHPGLKADLLAHEADLAMYVEKAEYYRTLGKDRRRNKR